MEEGIGLLLSIELALGTLGKFTQNHIAHFYWAILGPVISINLFPVVDIFYSENMPKGEGESKV